MLKKIVYISTEENTSSGVQKACVAGHNHGNYAPKNFRSISEEEFAKSSFFPQSPWYYEYAQYTYTYEGNPLPKAICCEVFYFNDGTGFALEQDYWAGKVNYYAFGCSHKYKELSEKETRAKGVRHFGECWHVLECQLCGHMTSYDSSD